MAKAKKLPSGNWRVQIYSHTDGTGKRHYESFTASSKHEAEMLAAQFKSRNQRIQRNQITVYECIDKYLTAKQGVLSPSTITSNRSMQRRFYESIKAVRIERLDSAIIQTWVSELSSRYSPKTVRNAYALLTASLRFSSARYSFDGVTLPTRVKRRISAPTDADVANLFNAAKPRLKLAIALAAFGSLRRGEVCALKYKDISGGKAFVHADVVIDGSNGWFYKDYPKTSDSIREVWLPPDIINMIGSGDPEDFILNYKPSGLSKAYELLQKRLGTHIRFHDLRHYYASIGAVLHIPDIYLASFGGWKQSSPVMKDIYQNPIAPASEEYGRIMTEHFTQVMNNATRDATRK